MVKERAYHIHLHFRRIGVGCVFCLLMGMNCAFSQISEKVYQSEYRIDPQHRHKLFVTLDNLSFFRNNEYATVFVPGYTLPGFWLQAKAVYYPTEFIKLEGGLHSLWYWGANKYPAYSYRDLPARREGREYAAHLVPYFRAQVALSEQVNLILGSLYGGTNHDLIEPLYNPELHLTADPEAGLQLLYHTPWLAADCWVDWTTFIYQADTRQEVFTFGFSSRFQSNPPESRIHIYFPLQVVAQHYGGQIDITNLPVQTLSNSAVGVGVDWHFDRRVLKKINVEGDLTGYLQHAGESWPLKRGHGIYAAVTADLSCFRVKSSYWQCNRYISIFGNPLYGAVSMSAQEVCFIRPKMISSGLEYTRSLAPGFTLGIDFNAHYRLPDRVDDPAAGEGYSMGAKMNYDFGIYLRVNPSFLIKTFAPHVLNSPETNRGK
jgi:hypothetical protein